MKRLALFLLLAGGWTAHAALPRVTVETPLTAVSAPAYTAAPEALSLTAEPQFLGAAPALVAAPALAAAPAAASVALEPAFPAAGRAPTRAAAASDGPRAIDALRANAPLAEKLAAAAQSSSPEDAARAAEGNFNAAAALGGVSEGGSAPPLARERGAVPSDPLLTRLLALVRLDEGGTPERRAALTRAFARVLETPTGRAFAERFVVEKIPADVRFETFPESRIYALNGRRYFQAPRAYTHWRNGRVELRLNQDYLGSDAEFQDQDLPPTLAHELFGHGLWYARAARENALQAFHHHELNETNARLVGWLVDYELDHRFEESGARSYLADPVAFQAYLKLRLPYYATTWSTQELARPRETLEERSAAAKVQRADIAAKIANHAIWNRVIAYFAKHRRIKEPRLRALRAFMVESEQGYRDELKIMDALIEDVDATIARMNAEPERDTERYLKWAATHPLFPALKSAVEENNRFLSELVRRHPAAIGDESPASKAAREEHWRGQVTFEEIAAMYREDREKHPEHWQN